MAGTPAFRQAICLANAKARALRRLRDEHCADRPLFSEFIYNIAAAGAYERSPDELAGYVLRRFETVNSGTTRRSIFAPVTAA